MQAQPSAPRDGLVVASGYGIKIYVQRGHLVVHDGIGSKRTTQRFNRATSRLKRLVVIGNAGYMTLEAAQWLRDVGAAYIHLDRDGALLACSTPRTSDHPALRRAQVLATTNATGLEITRMLIRQKLEGQRAVASELPGAGTSPEAIRRALVELEQSASSEDLVAIEAQAADAYWNAWTTLPARFGRRDAAKVPDHWLAFGHRHSPLTHSPRLATNPSNAILNYLYALLEAETTVACSTVGLDPGLAIVHTDKKGRASLSLDLMEACRPAADAYALTLLTERKLRARDFAENRRGVCRLLPAAASELTSTLPIWRLHTAPIAELVAHMLARSVGQAAPPTPLTQTRRRSAVAARRRNGRTSRSSVARLPATCLGCGTPLDNRRTRYCSLCRRDQLVRGSAIKRVRLPVRC